VNNIYQSLIEDLGWPIPTEPVNLAPVPKPSDGYFNYAILIQGRCGSTWFGKKIEDCRALGLPLEWFNTPGMKGYAASLGSSSLEQYVANVSERSEPFAFQINPLRLQASANRREAGAARKIAWGLAIISLIRRIFRN